MRYKNFWWSYIYIYTFIFYVIIDRISKWWAFNYLYGKEEQVLPFLNLNFSWNKGISWGLFNSFNPLTFYLLTFSIAIIIVLFFAYTLCEHRRGSIVIYEVVLLSGAVSNFIDRIIYGAVIDFLDFHAFGYHWPTFNLADSFIVLGAIGIILKGLGWISSKK